MPSSSTMMSLASSSPCHPTVRDRPQICLPPIYHPAIPSAAHIVSTPFPPPVAEPDVIEIPAIFIGQQDGLALRDLLVKYARRPSPSRACSLAFAWAWEWFFYRAGILLTLSCFIATQARL